MPGETCDSPVDELAVVSGALPQDLSTFEAKETTVVGLDHIGRVVLLEN